MASLRGQDSYPRYFNSGYAISMRIPEPGTFSKRFPSTVSTYVAEAEPEGGVDSIAMGIGLTTTGIVWTLVSFLGTCLCCTGLIFPYWITGSMLEHPVHFGLFRRCNYPTSRAEIAVGCGRYSSFEDIPTLSWQLCTILLGVGCVVSMLVAFTGIFACCVKDLVTQRVGKVAGVIQFFAACLVGSGCVLYPNGWSHVQVKAACGETSGSYQIGDCSISWAYLVTAGGCGLLLLASILSCKAGPRKSVPYGI
ncbi:LHFPL tetraspan subfamily member 6 protein-like isoform X1 [Asterias amurensis]|uniref:LHFPL tetraspan subfamily member 6 protein-like isoform X1 n=1 Tax=Asterias amurensis TaxID=7602 RepID=UPI003AB38B02